MEAFRNNPSEKRAAARRVFGSAAILFFFAALGCGFACYYLGLANELLPGVVEVNNPLDPFVVQRMLEYWTGYSLILGLFFSCGWMLFLSRHFYPRFRLRTGFLLIAMVAVTIFVTSSDLALLFWKSYPLSRTVTTGLVLMAMALVVWLVVRRKRTSLTVVTT